MTQIQQLIEISHFYGKNPDFVIAGGGNTSYKNNEYLWVKASGTTLADITENGFAELDRGKLAQIAKNSYSSDSSEREQQIKTDLFRASVYPEKNLRPSVETSMHDILNYAFVVHTHPTLVNALLCSAQCEQQVKALFGEKVLYIPYTDPGYVLFKAVEAALIEWRKNNSDDPSVILLQNHGIFVSANTIDEIKETYQWVMTTIEKQVTQKVTCEPLSTDARLTQLVPAIRMQMSAGDAAKIVTHRHNSLIAGFYASEQTAALLPFTPDIIVYCKARPLYIEQSHDINSAIAEFTTKYAQYRNQYGYDPKMILVKDLGLLSVEDHYKAAETALDVFEDLMKIYVLTANFGGPKFMNEREIAFIDNWEVENYRRAVSKGASGEGRVANKICVVTGAAQGFGAGIAESLFDQQANVVIADLNEQVGKAFEQQLNAKARKNRALFVKCDVSDEASVKNLIDETTRKFGGLDAFISNAGVLRAGGLDEMTFESFEFMTKVNYTGYFLCAKHASAVLKLQAAHKAGYFTDIIQINSKSGLKGSNKNFAYAGGKFGGIGLTQSFALELIPHNIKVNSVCPGNFFDGPLWSDPEKGLFVQYLNAGKVPGAKSVSDVKKFYESQVPAKRGCSVPDVMKAVYYIMEQEYETGQAVPVTGGQEMLR